jgi:hypothetical protein
MIISSCLESSRNNNNKKRRMQGIGKFRSGVHTKHGTDKTRQDKTRQDKTRQDKTGQDKTRQDKTRQDKHGTFITRDPHDKNERSAQDS